MSAEVVVRVVDDWRPELARLAAEFVNGKESAETTTAYKGDLKSWFTWLEAVGLDPHAGMQFTDGRRVVRTGDVLLWVAALKKRGEAASTRARRLAAVSSFYGWWERDHPEIRNPTRALLPAERPKAPTDDTYGIALTADQVKTLVKVADEDSPRSGALVALLALTGARISEILRVTVADFDVDRGETVLRLVTKGDQRRNPVMRAAALARVERLRKVHPAGSEILPAAATPAARYRPLFVSKTGGPWSRTAAAKIIHRLGLKIGIPNLHPHDLRRTYITLLLESGASLEDVAEDVGHRSIATTLRYARRIRGSAQHTGHRIANMLDLPDLPEETL